MQAPGPERVTQGNRDVVLSQDLEDIVIALVERVLPAVMHHPDRVERSATANDAGYPSMHERQMLEQDPGVQGHVVDPLPRLMFDQIQ